MSAKAAEMQREVRENAEDYQNYLKDLYQWENEIKVKDELLKNAPKSPSIAGEQEFPIRNRKTIFESNENPTSNCPSVQNSGGLTDHQNRQKAVLEKNKGNECFKEEKYEKAIECYSKAMELDPSDAILPANRAIALIKVKRFVEAEEDCNTSLKLDPTFVKAYHRRGTARFHTGKMEQALDDFKKVLSIEPHNKAALQEFERLSKLSKDSSKSTALEKSKEINSKKRVSFDQSVTNQTKKAVEIEPLKGASEIIDLSLKHPSLTVVNEFVPVPNNGKTEPDVQISIAVVNDSKQESLGIDKLINQLSGQKNIELKTIEIQTAKIVEIIPPSPKNCIQFYQDWTRLDQNSDLQYQYLKQINPTKLPDLFRESLETDILGGIIKILKMEFVPRKDAILPWLTGLSRVKRIGAVTLFLSSDQKSDLDFLQTCINSNNEGTEEERNSVFQKLK
ncbi:RNA polymerase II-associated protein 3-like isoform X1 [Daphnia pulex]|uniref:RNA polymerase II-associated protein 3-like isoform X1 n=1 Tax=Daphnia pulex TaxID=6669 RepID=UPI001EE0123E|nr:RNA polymerase II-associated protein 3-like isoform X1 [Daphnia pulex]